MNKRFKLIEVMVVVALVALLGISVMAGEQSKGASSTSAAHYVSFAAQKGKITASSVYAKSATASADLDFYVKSGVGVTVTTAPTNGATVIAVANTAFTTNDIVCYNYSDGLDPLFTTVSASSTTSITLADAITQAGTSKDRIYEMAADTVFIGSAAFNPVGGQVFVTPNDSPLVAKNTGISNGTVLVTGKWK